MLHKQEECVICSILNSVLELFGTWPHTENCVVLGFWKIAVSRTSLWDFFSLRKMNVSSKGRAGEMCLIIWYECVRQECHCAEGMSLSLGEMFIHCTECRGIISWPWTEPTHWQIIVALSFIILKSGSNSTKYLERDYWTMAAVLRSLSLSNHTHIFHWQMEDYIRVLVTHFKIKYLIYVHSPKPQSCSSYEWTGWTKNIGPKI